MSDAATLSRGSSALVPAAASSAWLGEWMRSHAPVYCRDLEGRILAVNGAFRRKFGRPNVVLEGLSTAQCLHPDDAAGFQPGVLPGRGFGRNRPHPALADAARVALVHLGRDLAAGDGSSPVAIRAVGRDVTRQRLAEELYLKLSQAVDQSPIAIVITDIEGRVQYVNPRFIQISGCSLEDVLDRNLPLLRDGHPSEESYQAFWATVRAGREWHGELGRLRPNGTQIWESVQVSPMRNGNGEITNLLCMREDITERRRLEDDLRQAQKMESLGTLAGGIAHDFNNLLAVMSGYADISLLHLDDEAMLQKSLREIQRAVQRASGLVRQILTFSRKVDANFSALDMNQLVRELVSLLAETFPRTVNFALRLAEGIPPLVADHNQLQQIVLNLCVNARDAMPTGGTITLTTRACLGSETGRPEAIAGQTYVALEVSDTGTGMSPEVRARIFEPFFTTKPVNKGTGLGLSVVYGIVASHRGLIDIDSAVDVGSTFKIYLPATATATVTTAAVLSQVFPGGSESVLVVDDEDPLRKLLTTALSRKGYSVKCACDGLEAIDRINDLGSPLDAVLLDLNMPGASGLAVMHEIKARRPQLKVLMFSGHLSAETRADFERLGHRDFLNKPYSLDELGRRLRELLDRPKPDRAGPTGADDRTALSPQEGG